MIRRTDNALSLWLIVTVSMVSWFSALPSLLITQWWWRDVERHWWDYKIELLIYNRILKLFDMSFKCFILGHEYLRSSHPWDHYRPPMTNRQWSSKEGWNLQHRCCRQKWMTLMLVMDVGNSLKCCWPIFNNDSVTNISKLSSTVNSDCLSPTSLSPVALRSNPKLISTATPDLRKRPISKEFR